LALSGTLGAATAPATWVRWFSDDFEDGTPRRWKFADQAPPSDARIERDGDNQVMALRGGTSARARTACGSDYRLKARLKLVSGRILMAVRDTCERYVVDVGGNRITLQRVTCGGQFTNLRAVNHTLEPNKWYVFEPPQQNLWVDSGSGSRPKL
jgi:hypothetical protein